MRSITAIALGTVMAGLAGCTGPASEREAVDQQNQPVLALSRPTPHLLFDRRPSELYSPQCFTYRSAWPAAQRGFSGGEYIEYEEYLVDRERDFPSFHDRTYRRFSARRRGTSFR